jgi:hypothetical protein
MTGYFKTMNMLFANEAGTGIVFFNEKISFNAIAKTAA